MSVQDPIAHLLTKVRNATMARHRYVDVARSKMSVAIISLMDRHGFIQRWIMRDEENGKGTIRVFLKYDRRKPLIRGLRRHSSPGRRQYVGFREIPSIQGNLGIAIVSTSKGVLERSEARRQRLGGELLCSVW